MRENERTGEWIKEKEYRERERERVSISIRENYWFATELFHYEHNTANMGVGSPLFSITFIYTSSTNESNTLLHF